MHVRAHGEKGRTRRESGSASSHGQGLAHVHMHGLSWSPHHPYAHSRSRPQPPAHPPPPSSERTKFLCRHFTGTIRLMFYRTDGPLEVSSFAVFVKLTCYCGALLLRACLCFVAKPYFIRAVLSLSIYHLFLISACSQMTFSLDWLCFD